MMIKDASGLKSVVTCKNLNHCADKRLLVFILAYAQMCNVGQRRINVRITSSTFSKYHLHNSLVPNFAAVTVTITK